MGILSENKNKFYGILNISKGCSTVSGAGWIQDDNASNKLTDSRVSQPSCFGAAPAPDIFYPEPAPDSGKRENNFEIF